MAYRRTPVKIFQLSNTLYQNATVSFQVIDVNGLPTGILIPLYKGPTGAPQAANPQTLDSTGKLVLPVWHDLPYAAVVDQANAIPNQTTGAWYPDPGGFQGPWAAGTKYQNGDEISDPATGNLYVCQIPHIATVFATDVAAGDWLLLLNVAVVTADVAAAAASAALAGSSQTTAAANAAAAEVSQLAAAVSAGSALTSQGTASAAATTATAAVTAAAGSAAAALASATAAALSAASAAGVPLGTSSTSMTIGVGTFNPNIGTGKNVQIGEFLIFASLANVANYMIGQVSAYNSTTGASTINTALAGLGGSGTFSDWQWGISGPPALAVAWTAITSTPTTLSGYGITDALKASNSLSDILSATTARANLGLGTASQHAATDFLAAANNLSDVTAGTARTNLGLGSSATHAASDFALVANNLSDVTAATARTNLGLGTAATHAATDFPIVANNLSDMTAATVRTNIGLGTAATHPSGDFALVANNLSDVTAATARTNLGVAIGSNVQAWDADLDALAALAATTGMLSRTGAGAFAVRTITGTANEITVGNGDGASGAPTLSLPAALTFTGKTVTGGTLSGNSHKDVLETSQAVSASSTTTVDLSAGNTIVLSQAASITTLTLTNPPGAAPAAQAWTIVRKHDASGTTWTIAWPAAFKWTGGLAPTLTQTTGAVDLVTFFTVDGGTTYYASAILNMS